MQQIGLARWRFHAVFAALAAALVALGGRVGFVQFCRGKELAALARRQQHRKILLPARPGNIFARSVGGPVLLAASRQVPSVYADPGMLTDEEIPAVSGRVAAALQVPVHEVLEAIAARRNQRFVYLARDVSEARARAVRKLNLPAVRVTHEWRRHYPNGETAAHVLGFRRIDGVAGAGMEQSGDHWLRACDGWTVLGSDAGRRGRYAEPIEYHPPRDGQHVVLTLDLMIQGFLERALAQTYEEFARREVTDPRRATAAMGVVMDPTSGEVLAMASIPTFDPNRYGLTSSDQRRNRVITDPYEPGSAYKPIIAVGAVQLGKADLATEFYCHHGTYHAHRGGTIRDFPGTSFGQIDLVEIVVRSSNIGMAKLGERLGNTALHRISDVFGFGRRTGIELPGECPGRLVPARRWTSYATRRLPFGQGPITVTTLQLASAFSAIANGGVLLRARVIDRVVGADGQVVYRSRRTPIRRVLTDGVARRFCREVLAEVVRRGTGRRCRLEKWQAFGKTGTAQIGGPGGYEEGAYTATFVGGAPALRPRVVCAISVYRPDYARGYTGGKVAAPAVCQVLQRTLEYLRVPPDDYERIASRLAGRGERP